MSAATRQAATVLLRPRRRTRPRGVPAAAHQGHAVRRRDDRLPRRRRRPARRRHRDRLGRSARPRSGPPRSGATSALARELVCAAVRETFEEAGVLLAGPARVRSCRTSPGTTGRSSARRCSAATCRWPSCWPAAGWCSARTCCGPSRTGSPRRWSPAATTPSSSWPALPAGQEARRRLRRGRRGRVAGARRRAGGAPRRRPADAPADVAHAVQLDRFPTSPERWPARRRTRWSRSCPGFEDTPEGRFAVLPNGDRVPLVAPKKQ